MGLCEVRAVKSLFLADLTVTQQWTNDQLLSQITIMSSVRLSVFDDRAAEISVSGIAIWYRGQVTMAIQDTDILAVRFCCFTAHHTQYDRLC